MIDDAGTALFSDDQLQTILDTHNQRIYWEQLQYEVTPVSAGAAEYRLYHSRFNNFEEGGTEYFLVCDSSGTPRGTADYSVDYASGLITMNEDQHGTALYLSGWSYDLNGAAAVCWGERMAKEVTRYDINLDGHSLSRSQLMAQCKQMAEYYAQRARPRRVRMWNNGIFEQ
jgi:hypothetical protein